MAQENKKGTPFLGLGLHKHEEEKLQHVLKDEDLQGKQLLRTLVRNYLSGKTVDMSNQPQVKKSKKKNK